jgi:hypothetical protein
VYHESVNTGHPGTVIVKRGSRDGPGTRCTSGLLQWSFSRLGLDSGTKHCFLLFNRELEGGLAFIMKALALAP